MHTISPSKALVVNIDLRILPIANTEKTICICLMDFKGVKYQFKAKVWRYDGPNGWYFVTLPKDYSKEIRATMRSEEEGWGRLKATASIGSSEWKTAIWFDTKSDAYLLAIKAQIRSDEEIDIGKIVNVTVWI